MSRGWGLRHVAGLLLLLLAALPWLSASDVIGLVIRERPVLLGRYSQGHFSTAFLLSLWLLIQAALLFWPMPRADRIFASVMVPLSSVLALLLVVLATGWMNQPRYLIQAMSDTEAGRELGLAGVLRHRPPDEHYRLVWTDAPEWPRSYPGRPGGFGTVSIELSTDRHGFRNPEPLQAQYPILAVGDSFVAGSHVSDAQVWTRLLAERLGLPVYNLGVSGSSPQVYLNNYAALGRQFQPQTVLVMIYAGNDFRYEPPLAGGTAMQAGVHGLPLADRLEWLAKASPVVQGLRRLSLDGLQAIAAGRPIPGYAEQMGWMPLPVPTPAGTHYYAFPPKRLRYLNVEHDAFAGSPGWQQVRETLQRLQALAVAEGSRLILVYAPSTPHVVLPLVEAAVPAEQLHRFLAYEMRHLPDPESLKAQLFSRLDTQEDVFFAFCAEQALECVSLTRPLREAVQRGEQVYYSYDQHWSPLGNAVVADVLAGYLGP